MKGSECKFVKYMEGSDKRFVIPVYQRNYDWKTENCKQLYDDLVKIIKGHRKSHFFGSLVSVYNPDGHNEEFLIIDGQQRLTTVSLLFLAMYNLIDKGVIVPETANLKQRIFEEYLVDKWKPEDTRIKLKPVKNDQKAFGKLFSDPTEHIRESNLTVNYDYFYDRIQKQEITIDQLYDAICCLEIINIRLDMDDNPQLIFESLNSTGLDLSEGDKIRNFILMGLPSKEQEDYYEKYWNKIEVCTKYDVSAFIRDYLSVKQQAIPQQKKIYINFKDFVELGKIETEPLLAEMLAYAKRYQILLDGNSGSAALDACIDRLNRLETTVTRPYFLEALRLYNENKLTLAQVTEIFLTTENYLFRRTMCDLPTNALNKIFLMLHREIIRYDGTEDNYVEKLKYALLSKKERARFPDDVEFKAAFEERPVYLMNSKNKIYILERFENFGTSEDKDVYRHCDDGTYSIEHIMPQHLTPVWQKELGDDYEQIHEIWLHRMANLTLTAYNSKYSNSSFTEKKTMQNGFDDSGIRMNTWIAKKDKWTLTELEERSEYLMGRALSIWSAPVTEYKPEEKQLDTYTLEDNLSFSAGIMKLDSVQLKSLIDFLNSHDGYHLEELQDLLYKAYDDFIKIYQRLIPALALQYCKDDSFEFEIEGSTTSSFDSVKQFYLDVYETLGNLLVIPVAFNNIKYRADVNSMNPLEKKVSSLEDFIKLTKASRYHFCLNTEVYTDFLDVVVNAKLRNAIGHNDVEYDAVSQVITYIPNPKDRTIKKTEYLLEFENEAMHMFQALLGVSEYLYRLRELSLMYDGKIPLMVQERANWPKKIGRNDPCPCGIGKKYKFCHGKN